MYHLKSIKCNTKSEQQNNNTHTVPDFHSFCIQSCHPVHSIHTYRLSHDQINFMMYLKSKNLLDKVENGVIKEEEEMKLFRDCQFRWEQKFRWKWQRINYHKEKGDEINKDKKLTHFL